MSRRNGQRQQHFILNQRQHRQLFFGIYGIGAVIDQIFVRPFLPRRYQLQPALDTKRKLDSIETTLTTQHRLACYIHLQPRLAFCVAPTLYANRQDARRCSQLIRQSRQFIKADTANQHTTDARELKTVDNCSGNWLRHGMTLARHKRWMLSWPALYFQV